MTKKIEHDPQKLAVRWCRVVLWQSSRLREVQLTPGPASNLRPGFFDRLAAEQHFLLTATSQLEVALRRARFKGGLSKDLTRRVGMLRDVREHWDEWHMDKRSQAKFREQWPDVSPWTLVQDSDQLSLAGLVTLDELEGAVSALLDRLLEWRAGEAAAHGQQSLDD